MKKYEKPTIKVIVLESSPLLAGSARSVTNEYSDGAQLSREFDFEEEEFDFEEEF